MGRVTSGIVRNGRQVGRHTVEYPEGDIAAFKKALAASSTEAKSEAKADFGKRHIGRKAFRRKKTSA
ncbi:MAG TPA: hypothetical protein VHC39_04060 [Rhizomicrobium sp.]|nr:hypothetical protein [Rhizomicrobium sp.]